MNIKKVSPLSPVGRTYGPNSKNSGASTISAPSASGGDIKISLSAASTKAMQASDGDVRMDKVNEIRNALVNGTLVIDPERIADGLIDSAKELLGK